MTHNDTLKKRSGEKVTYMSSLVWRSMGSWVSLSMWKRTSKDDSVNALKDIKCNTNGYRSYDQLN